MENVNNINTKKIKQLTMLNKWMLIDNPNAFLCCNYYKLALIIMGIILIC